jgi:hypothetical protein
LRTTNTTLPGKSAEFPDPNIAVRKDSHGIASLCFTGHAHGQDVGSSQARKGRIISPKVIA